MSANLTGHLSPDDPELSPITRAMVALRGQVLQAWMDEVRSAVPQAEDLSLPVLENTLPAYFDTLAALLTPNYSARVVTDLGALASEHGGERARLTLYDATALIHELQIFRDVLVRQLERHGVRVDEGQRAILFAHIDATIRESANAFTVVQAALREQFVASMAHDLRTPLSTAQLAAEMINHTSSDENVRRFAEKIVASTQRIDGMTRELLDRIAFCKTGPVRLRLERFDMAALVRDVVQSAEPFHAIELALGDDPVEGWWCGEAIRRAIENLVNNAIKYGSREVPITVTLSTTVERVQVMVHNQGPPIAPEDSESIFQLYRRAGSQGPGQGWGVGLPYVRRVAEAHGGSVIMSSSVEDGTAFVIDLPADARPFAGAPTAA
ncbi:sensor histidine kinase KdpD [Massilia sp. IC2-476]|uniref:sensor histidine kinase n=1 Tax=Massilia sp. IC2-476 TaxID=2887199 RepID=UPI001D104E3A|nr:HAMP domain-containing sensor histidine kinase [Massilia sp. IC2-476]MCC2971820.1 HAMP domain-containing histidine kinase [Massilia sp. IC2-476]